MQPSRIHFQFVLLAALFPASMPAQEASGEGTLFASSPSAESTGPAPFLRHRQGRLATDAVAVLRAAANVEGSPARIVLNLFSNEQHTVTLPRITRPAPGRAVLAGHLEGQPYTEVVIALSGETVAGSVLVPGRGLFQIQPSSNGWHRITEVDAQRPPTCGVQPSSGWALDDAASDERDAAAPFQLRLASEPLTNVIDLLVVYTPAARAGAGGPDGISALIDAAVAEANHGYENSAVNLRLRLVHREEIAYTESGRLSEDLDELEEEDPDDPAMARAHELRSQHRADLVCLLVETTDGPLGLANQMTELDVDFSERAFCVVERQHVNAYQVFAHELGHLMGGQHDRSPTTGPGCYDYSHGHRFTTSKGTCRTVMALQPGWPIPYFSNPDVNYLGVPTGIDAKATNAANNARTLNLTAATVARFSTVLRTGTPPSITLLAPTNGARYPWPGIVEFTASVVDDGLIEEVEFFVNGRKFAELEQPPFSVTWTNQPGVYVAHASVHDASGWERDSVSVVFSIDYPPPTFDPRAYQRLPDGRFSMRARGFAGIDYVVEHSQNLIDWTPLTSGVFTFDTVEIIDDSSSAITHRFYRIRREF